MEDRGEFTIARCGGTCRQSSTSSRSGDNCRELACFKLKKKKREKMPVHRQPNSLEGIGFETVCKHLNRTCRRLQLISQESSAAQVLSYVKREIRPYYVNALPSAVRSRIIEETTRMLYGPSDSSTHITGPAPLYLLALLLGRDIKHLKINLCCYYGCSHQTSLLKLIANEGTGLESLELARAALLRLDAKLLRSALSSTKNLSSLTLRNIASDVILEIIGKVCPKLVVLDVACSRQVTDAGLRKLLLQLELRDKLTPQQEEDEDRLQQQQQQQQHQRLGKNHCHRRDNREIGSWSRIKTLLSKIKVRSQKNMKKDVDGIFLEYRETRNALCETLRVLNVATTGITSPGIIVALEHAVNLESLAEYNHVGRVIEMMERSSADVKTTLNLTQARSCRTSTSRLELLAQTCPKIEKLQISEPHHSPEDFGIFSRITCLTVNNVPGKKEWINGFYDYLRARGNNLRELNLRLATNESAITQIDIREIFVNCPNLEKLTKDGFNVVWLEGAEPETMKKLKKIQLGRSAAARTVGKILTIAPELVAFHLHSCYDITDRHWRNIENRSLPNLTCFYVYEANGLSAKTVLNMFNSCKNLGRIGNLVNWGLDCESVDLLKETLTRANLDVELCPGSHWFWSSCIQ